MRGDSSELATVPCSQAPSQPMNCCRGAHCRCDLSAPCQSASNRMPARATPTPGQRVAKVTVISAGAALLASEVACYPASTARATASTPAAASSYLWTHAFLI
jgi:hypothetical protein